MKVKELIEHLKEYNPEAKVDVIANCHPYDFSITYGHGDNDYEGCTKGSCERIGIYVDELNRYDAETK